MGHPFEQFDLELQLRFHVFVLIELLIAEVPLFQHLDEAGDRADRRMAGVVGLFPTRQITEL
jgi:hypothetical protein